MSASRVLIVVIIATALSGCGGPDPGTSPEPSPPESPPAAQTIDVEVYFAHAQPMEVTLIGEPHAVEVDDSEEPLETVLADLISGELPPADPDYANLWGAGSALLSTARSGDVLTLDLTVGDLNLGAEAEAVAIAQLVWTAIGIDPSITAVQLTIDGTVSETLAGHVDISSPLVPEPAENVLTPVQITAPQQAVTVMSPVVATGVACVFEATVSWQLAGPDGAVSEGYTMASEACPVRAPWVLELGDLAAGDYLLTVIEYSMRDGSVASTDSKHFVVE